MIDYVATLPSFEPYLGGIKSGWKNKTIVGQGRYRGPWDPHGHLPDKDDHTTQQRMGALRWSNTRAISSAGVEAVRLMIRRGDAFRFMELGIGSGRGCLKVRQMCGDAGIAADIDAVGLTPVDPCRLPRKNVAEMVDEIAANPAVASSLQGDAKKLVDDALYRRRNLELGYLRLRLDAALALQDAGTADFFHVSPRPLIDRQYIGDIRALPLSANCYDLVHDDHGPACHLDCTDYVGSIRRITCLLAPEGIAVLSVCDVLKPDGLYTNRGGSVSMAPFMCVLRDPATYDEEGGVSAKLVMRGESDIGEQVKRLLGRSSPAGMHVVNFDPAELLSWLE